MAADPFSPELPSNVLGLLSVLFGGMATAIAFLWRALQESNRKRAERELAHWEALLVRDRQAIEGNNRVAAILEKQTAVMEAEARNRQNS